jgi:hypothetical protein
VLAAFLGSTALSACRKGVPELPTVDGRFVDDVHLLGHVLRAAAPARAAVDARVLEVLIVGGGVAGLSAGWRLRGAGCDDFVVAEVDAEVGGTARSGRNETTPFPWGAHYLPAPLTDIGPTSRVLRELGVMTGTDADGAPQYAEQVLVREPDERLFLR